MTKSKTHIIVSDETIINKIFLIRGKKVLLDKDLATLYGVTTGNLNKAIARNPKRFPDDFMFQLTKDEFDNLIFQNGTSRSGWGGTRKLPNVFTEQGVAMLSSVLNSEIAIEVNIRIIRIFTRIREVLLTHKEILLKLEQLEKKLTDHDEEIEIIFNTLKELIKPEKKELTKIGYKIPEKNYNK